jgi:hypothetical protein
MDPAPTSPTTMEVVVDDDWIRVVARMPPNRATSGLLAVSMSCSAKPFAEQLEGRTQQTDADQKAVEERQQGADPHEGAQSNPSGRSRRPWDSPSDEQHRRGPASERPRNGRRLV